MPNTPIHIWSATVRVWEAVLKAAVQAPSQDICRTEIGVNTKSGVVVF